MAQISGDYEHHCQSKLVRGFLEIETTAFSRYSEVEFNNEREFPALATRKIGPLVINPRMAVNVDFFANVLELGLLLILLAVARILGVSWPRLSAGVALGFGISAGIGAAVDTVFSQWGSPAACDLIEQSVSVLTAILWLVCLLTPEKPDILKEKYSALSNLDTEVARVEKVIRGY